METVTSNASCSPSTISVSGKETSPGTISWSIPTVPSGVIISSCVLTGKTSSFTTGNKGATCTINGTSVDSDSDFSINLGTANTTSSVSVSFTGSHKQSNTSVSFSNLVYTVTYELPKATYTVTFVDWDGTVLKTEQVEEGSSATAPANPTRDDYKFTGWDKAFDNITSDLTVTAQYTEVIRHLVARYTANTSGAVPEFNEGYDYSINETESNGIYTVEIQASEDFTQCSFIKNSNILTIEYLKITNNVTDMSDLFDRCTSLESVNTDGWDTSNVTKMTGTFQECSSLVSLDVSSFDVNNVTRMDFMFQNCMLLTSLDLSKWNTNSLTITDYIFSNCNQLTQLDLSSWNVSNVKQLNYMFSECTRLNQINISNWKIPSTTYMNNMFNLIYRIDTVIMNNSDYNSVNKIIARLPARTSDSPGTLNIEGVDDLSQVDIATAESKFWNVVEEPEEPDLTEPVDGYIAKNLVSYGDWSYTFNVDWDTQYLDIEVLGYNIGEFGTNYYYRIINNSYDVYYTHESVDDFTIHDVEVESYPEDIDVIRYSKVDGVCIITSDGTQIIPGNSFANDTKTTIEADISTELLGSYDGFMTFNIKITDITSSEEPDSGETTYLSNLHLGNVIIDKLYLGNVQVNKVYLGETLIYSISSGEQEPNNPSSGGGETQ